MKYIDYKYIENGDRIQSVSTTFISIKHGKYYTICVINYDTIYVVNDINLMSKYHISHFNYKELIRVNKIKLILNGT